MKNFKFFPVKSSERVSPPPMSWEEIPSFFIDLQIGLKMQYLYFDNGAHRFLTRKHDDPGRDRVNTLISTISEVDGIDLEKGFKPVWAPGIYLERVFKGRGLLTELVQKIYANNLAIPETEEKLDDFLEQVKGEASTCAAELLQENPLPDSLKPRERGYAGADLFDDTMFRYTQQEKALLSRVYLEAEAVQQILMERLGDDLRKLIFHSCIKGFFIQYFEEKKDINLSRLILDYTSIAKGSRNNKKDRLIDPNKDLADGELIHFATFGSWVNNDLVPVIAITFDDNLEKIRSRLTSFKSMSSWVIAHSEYRRPIPWGKVIGIDKKSCETTLIDVEKLDFESWVYDESSEEALTYLEENSFSRSP